METDKTNSLQKKLEKRANYAKEDLPLSIPAFSSAFKKMAAEAEQKIRNEHSSSRFNPLQMRPDKSPDVGSHTWWQHHSYSGEYSGDNNVGFTVSLDYSVQGEGGFAGVAFKPSHVSKAAITVKISDNPRSNSFGCLSMLAWAAVLGVWAYTDTHSVLGTLLIGGIGGAIAGVVTGWLLTLMFPGRKEATRAQESCRLVLSVYSLLDPLWDAFQERVSTPPLTYDQREWTSTKSGQPILAVFVRADTDYIYVKKEDGALSKLSRDNLTPCDETYLIGINQ